jgi:amino acid transporter
MFALSRDRAFPDRLFFGKINKTTQTPLYAVGLATFLCRLLLSRCHAKVLMDKGILPGFLALASPYAAFAIFAMTTVGQSSIMNRESLAHLYYDSPGYFLHSSDRCPQNLRQPPRGAV